MAELLRAAGYTIQNPPTQTASNLQSASQEQPSLSDTSDSEEVISSKMQKNIPWTIYINTSTMI